MINKVIEKTAHAGSAGLALPYLVREPQIASTKKKAIILLHGVGSNEQDLFSLADLLPREFFIISPRGQFTLGAGRYAWYQVDFSTGRPVIDTMQEASSREVIRHFIKQIKEKYNLDEVYLGGFSQGAIMTYSLGILYPNEVQGIIALSGRVLEEIRPLVNINDALKTLRAFVAHGVDDNMLPVQYARQAKDYIEGLGVRLTYKEYLIGHQIGSEVLQDLSSWLK